MQDLLGLIAGLNRPRLLVRAARFGVDEYNRSLHLPRLLGAGHLPRNGESIVRQIDMEADLNDRRVGATADYSIARHVAILIALMGEARLLRAMTRSA